MSFIPVGLFYLLLNLALLEINIENTFVSLIYFVDRIQYRNTGQYNTYYVILMIISHSLQLLFEYIKIT